MLYRNVTISYSPKIWPNVTLIERETFIPPAPFYSLHTYSEITLFLSKKKRKDDVLT